MMGASSLRISWAFLWNSICAATSSARLRSGSGVSRTYGVKAILVS